MLVLLWSAPLEVMAQSPQPAAAPSQPLLKEAELDQLLAPIALYPDPLLSQVLIASTYPLEVVQADRWAKSNANLKGDALTAALDKQSWDDSIKALVQVPSVLTMMSEQLEWAQKLGDAMLAQQADVMDSIQRLRARAQSNGKLASTKEQTVTTQSEGDKQYIVIEPASPTEIHVPYYEPAVVYGAWPYPEYAPYYFPPAAGYPIARAALATGIAFGAGVVVGRAAWGRFNWARRDINVAVGRSANFAKWEHNVAHRHGVRYGNAEVRQKFARTDIQAGRGVRQDFRGREGQQVLDPGRGRPGGTDRPGGIDRPGGPPGSGAAKGVGPKAAPKASQLPAQRPQQRDTAFSNVGSGKATRAQADRGRQSVQHSAAARPAARTVSPRPAARSGGARPMAARGGGARGGGRGGGRRSDVRLKHDIILLGHLDNGLGFYRFAYNGSDRAFVGVMAQEVQAVMPDAVVRDRDGYLRVFYDKLGLKLQTYDRWIASGARLPTINLVRH
jgi:hypothetical protein